jgi:hypothetical protein
MRRRDSGMEVRMRVVKFAAAALLLSAPVFAQDEIARKQATEIMARVPFEKAMKGAPYSAETVVENSQTLPDGNRISRKTTGAVYRDGEGRTRREEDVNIRAQTPNGFVSSVRKTISIVDPVAGYSYSLDPEKKIAWRTPAGGANAIMGKLEMSQTEASLAATREKLVLEEKMKAERKSGSTDEPSMTAAPTAVARGGGGGGRGGAVAPVGGGGAVARGTFAGNAYAIVPDGPLEHKTIEGVAVEGRKTTTVIPAGQVGNEQPITITSEEWRSPDLNLLVLTKHADPRSGESSYRLQNIIRAEPDHSLFMVPPDYEVKDTGIRRMLEASRKN